MIWRFSIRSILRRRFVFNFFCVFFLRFDFEKRKRKREGERERFSFFFIVDWIIHISYSYIWFSCLLCDLYLRVFGERARERRKAFVEESESKWKTLERGKTPQFKMIYTLSIRQEMEFWKLNCSRIKFCACTPFWWRKITRTCGGEVGCGNVSAWRRRNSDTWRRGHHLEWLRFWLPF